MKIEMTIRELRTYVKSMQAGMVIGQKMHMDDKDWPEVEDEAAIMEDMFGDVRAIGGSVTPTDMETFIVDIPESFILDVNMKTINTIGYMGPVLIQANRIWTKHEKIFRGIVKKLMKVAKLRIKLAGSDFAEDFADFAVTMEVTDEKVREVWAELNSAQ
jgi:predicted RNA-binding protein